MDDVQANLSNLAANEPAFVEPSSADFIADFLTSLNSETEKNQMQLIQEIATKGDDGLAAIMSFLAERRSQPPTALDGKAYQLLVAADTPSVQEFLQTQFPNGLVSLVTQRNIDYAPLQALLAAQDFQAADRITLEKLCELAGGAALQRRWVYFSQVTSFPIDDLRTLDTLWQVYSEGKFGFSVQRDLWLAMGKNWEKLWSLIGWKQGNTWTRYPNEFIWDLTAPKGHLPLSNQLRGVRVISSLLNHPAWTKGHGDGVAESASLR